jgi:hypothetical protein
MLTTGGDRGRRASNGRKLVSGPLEHAGVLYPLE